MRSIISYFLIMSISFFSSCPIYVTPSCSITILYEKIRESVVLINGFFFGIFETAGIYSDKNR